MRGFGYFISIISTLLLGAVAWPKLGEPEWKMVAVLGGVVLSIAGMGLRWIASRKQKRQIRELQGERS